METNLVPRLRGKSPGNEVDGNQALACVHHLITVLRLVSTQENYPWIGTDKKMFLCVKVISSTPELTRQRIIFSYFFPYFYLTTA
jgi:hypothetical protein